MESRAEYQHTGRLGVQDRSGSRDGDGGMAKSTGYGSDDATPNLNPSA